jgi:hypothetical protein
MLNEFLVLGRVPGTNFQITFNELALLFDTGLLFFALERYHQITQKIRYYRLYFHLLMSVKKGQQLSLVL